MRTWTVLCLATVLYVGAAMAGPNEGGVLLVHDCGLLYTSDSSTYLSPVPACDDVDAELPTGIPSGGTGYVWKVLAAFPENASPRLKATAFGATFGSQVYVLAGGLIDPEFDFQIAQDGWPLSSGGSVGLSFGQTKTGTVSECYWLGGYAYSGTWELTAHTVQGAVFVDDATPPNTDSIIAFGSLGFGTSGGIPCPNLAACCQPDGECQFTTYFQCEELDGVWLGGSCEPNPCPVQGDYGWGEATEMEDGSLELPLLPIEYSFWATFDHPNDFYVEQGGDGVIRLALRLVATGITRTMAIEVRDPEGEGLVWSAVVNVTDTPYDLPDLAWPRNHGMARVRITPLTLDGYLYELTARYVGGVDRLIVNDVELGYHMTNVFVLPFYVPSHATAIRLSVLDAPSPPDHAMCHLSDPSNPQFDWFYTGTVQEYSSLEEYQKGGIWRLEILANNEPYDPPHGLLKLQVRSENAAVDDWWTPDFAFALNPGQPVRAQLAPYEISPPGSHVTFLTPKPRPYDDESPYNIGDFGSLPRFLFCGTQHFLFTTWPGVPATVKVKSWGMTNSNTAIRWRTPGYPWQAGNIHRLAGGSTWEHNLAPLAGASASVEIRVAPVEDSTRQSPLIYDIITDAPGAVANSRVGPYWIKGGSDHSYLLGDRTWFYVPPGLQTATLTLEAKRDSCDSVLPYCYPIYPQAALTVTRPDGQEYSCQTSPASRGRATVHAPVEVFDGRLWSLQVGLSGEGPGHRNLWELSVQMGDSLPAWYTWLEKERFGLPVALPMGDLLWHADVRGGSWWKTMLPPERFASSASIASFPQVDTLKRYTPVKANWGKALVVGAESAVADTQRLSLRLFGPDALHRSVNVTSLRQPFYSLRRPIGLSPHGEIRTSILSTPGPARQFLSLNGPAEVWCANAPPACLEDLDEAFQKGFDTVGTHYEAGPYVESQGRSLAWQLPGFTDPYNPDDWVELENSAIMFQDIDGLLETSHVDEPLMKGWDPEVLRRASFLTRKHNPRLPISINEEVEARYARELGALAEIWTDDEYYDRGVLPRPLCHLIAQLVDLRRFQPPDRAIGVHLLAGFWESGAYRTADPDCHAAQILAAQILGSGFTDHYKRFEKNDSNLVIDLATQNPPLWRSFGPDSVLAIAAGLSQWRSDTTPYLTQLLGRTTTVCDSFPVVVAGAGMWLDSLGAGRLGTWFAFANLGDVAPDTIGVSRGLLRLPEDGDIAVVIHGASAGLPRTDVVVGPDALHCILPEPSWIVGHLSWTVDPAALADARADLRPPVLGSAPNPVSGPVTLRLGNLRGDEHEVLVFAVGGALVRALPLPALGSGEVTLEWDGRNGSGQRVPAGVYFARVRGRSGPAATERIVIVR